MFAEWFERRGYTTPPLTAEQLDSIVQKLAPFSEVWYTFHTSPMFRVDLYRWWSDEGHYVEYKIYFPRSVWKKIRNQLTDQEAFNQLLP